MSEISFSRPNMASKLSRHLQLLKFSYPWIKTPLIVSAPMRVFAGPDLATAVHRAGGIGFLGPGPKPSDLSSIFEETRQLLNIHNSNSPLPIGIGFQTFDADLEIAAKEIEKHRPVAVWLFAARDGQREFDVWIKRIKALAPDTKIWIQVGSVADAVAAAKAPTPPDVLVVQGSDAGGHGLVRGAGIISLLPEIADALSGSNIPLLAAGGISDGRGVAAALHLGAVGTVMGTRFLASTEAKISKGYQDDVVRTTDGGQNTVRTALYDELAGRTNWPAIYDGRNIVNRSWVDKEGGVDFEENKRKYGEASKKGDEGWGPKGRMTAYVGAGVGLVRSVEGASRIVETTREQARTVLNEARNLL
jgi:nitronate monooxygenase